MSYKRELPVKYCLDCETHFHAPPAIHEDVYHKGSTFRYVRGNWRKAERADDGVIRVW